MGDFSLINISMLCLTRYVSTIKRYHHVSGRVKYYAQLTRLRLYLCIEVDPTYTVGEVVPRRRCTINN